MLMNGIGIRIVRQERRYRRLINPCTTQSISEVVVRVRVGMVVDQTTIDKILIRTTSTSMFFVTRRP